MKQEPGLISSGEAAGDATVPIAVRWGLQEATLAVITFLWATNFLVTQIALEECQPLGFLAFRFGIAAVALLVCFPSRMRGLTRTEVEAAVAIGVTLFAAYVPQTIGLLYISVPKSAFIIALYVPLVPILQLFVLGKRPALAVWVGIALAFAGLVLLGIDESMDVAFGVGEWLTLGAAFACALQIILLGRWAPVTDPLRLAFVQIMVVALLCLAAMPIVGESLPTLTPGIVAAAVELGIVGTAFILAAMNWAQRTVSPARATVIYATEPVWAALLGMLAGQWLTMTAVAGGVLIVLGVVVSELRVAQAKNNDTGSV
jgi:drug/metabolite transporter (DMT)-like permease